MTFTPLNFLRTNASSVSLFYGRCPWHYYISQGLPILLSTNLPFFVIGTRKIMASGLHGTRELLYSIIWTTAVFSLAGHKEWRFLHPLLPLMLVLASSALVDATAKSKDDGESPSWTMVGSIPRHKLFLIAIGLLPGIYTTFYHSRAQLSVIEYLRSLEPTKIKSAGFLMPCHSTPWQSHLHRPDLASPGQIWSIGCEPPLG